MEDRKSPTGMRPRGTTHLRFHTEYLGFSLLFAWHYCLWFVPNTFPHIELLDNEITYAWFICLGVTSLIFFLLAGVIRKDHHLSGCRVCIWLVGPITALCSLFFTMGAGLLPWAITVVVLPVIFSISSAVFWLLWGELFARIRATFEIRDLGPSIAVPLLLSIVVASLLPAEVSSLFTALLPIGSSLLLSHCSKTSSDKIGYPIPQPKQSRGRILRNMVTISIMAFLASMACYYLLSVIPSEDIPGSMAFAFCTLAGGGAILVIYVMGLISKNRVGTFRVLPWLLIAIIISYAFFLSDNHAANASAFITVGAVYTVFELLLIMYFAVLMTRGYVSASTAFGLSGGFVRAGTLVGNIIGFALGGHTASTEGSATITTVAVVMLCVVAITLIPLVRQEYHMLEVMSSPSLESELDKTIELISNEFKLSGREAEILGLLARGLAAESIAKRLVISTYTVQTHVQHIYTKMGIHKRAELLDYISIQSVAPNKNPHAS